MENKFYVSLLFGEEVSWPASNFTFEELDVIERFLDELNDRISGETIDAIAILPCEEEP